MAKKKLQEGCEIGPEKEKTKEIQGAHPVLFGMKLRAKREEKGITQAQVASILGVRCRTVRRWEEGTRTPQARMQSRILRTLAKATVDPSPGRIAGARRNHHIDWEKGRGWFMRVTINCNRKTVGKRIKIRLKTRDLEEAIKRRDVVFASYRALGFHVTQTGVIVISKKMNAKDQRSDG